MSPTPTHFHHNQAKAKTSNNNNGFCPPPLRVNTDSYMINKKSSSSSSSLGVNRSSKTLQRHPVIIYTHSPKVIHTHPKDFMALVQKLTGLSRSDSDQSTMTQVKLEKGIAEGSNKNGKIVGNDDNESSSVITDENCGSVGDRRVNSCFVPPIFEPPNPYMPHIPVFTPTSAHFLCPNPSFYSYTDPLFLSSPNIRAPISSSSTTEGMDEFREY
ncbi:hypothetical protein K2173_026356 [Erythroxylum novogranatense]|uniref:VQ domain-containing protein n=1 Tax=Erythroxylum novogranatense TaxID=1862640 RepID=A0AAV8SNR7_9ROSI|nr:hypothetical protein K2173_026356 [Erythroxylum novogranatense]